MHPQARLPHATMPQAFSPTAATSSEAPRTPQQRGRPAASAASPQPAARTPRSASAVSGGGLGFTEQSVDRRRSGTPLHAPVQRRAREKIEVRSEVEKAEETAREAARLRRLGKERRRALRAPTTPPPPACRARATLASPVLFSPQQAGRQQLRVQHGAAVCPPPSALFQPAGAEAAPAAAAAAPSKLEAMRAKRKWARTAGGEASGVAADGASAEEVPAKRRALSLQARRTEAKEKALAAAAAAASATTVAEDAIRSPVDVSAAQASLGFRSAGQQQCGGRPAVAQGTLVWRDCVKCFFFFSFFVSTLSQAPYLLRHHPSLLPPLVLLPPHSCRPFRI